MRLGDRSSRPAAEPYRRPDPHRPALALLTVLAAAAAVSACSSTESTGVVGDSITVMTSDELEASEQDWDVEAVIGATAGEMVAPAEQLSERSPDQVVLNVGTNDALQRLPVDRATTDLERLVATFGDARCVHLVTISTGLPPTGEPPSADIAAQINEWIEQRAGGDERLRVIDWDAEVSAEPDLMMADRIHPDDSGQERLASMMAEAVRSC